MAQRGCPSPRFKRYTSRAQGAPLARCPHSVVDAADDGRARDRWDRELALRGSGGAQRDGAGVAISWGSVVAKRPRRGVWMAQRGCPSLRCKRYTSRAQGEPLARCPHSVVDAADDGRARDRWDRELALRGSGGAQRDGAGVAISCGSVVAKRPHRAFGWPSADAPPYAASVTHPEPRVRRWLGARIRWSMLRTMVARVIGGTASLRCAARVGSGAPLRNAVHAVWV